MHWIAGIDEVASETQVSEGWTYAVLPSVALSAIDSAVSHCRVKTFHGKTFRKAQAADYETFLVAARNELLNYPDAFLTFTLMDISWKSQFLAFSRGLIVGGMQGAGVTDSSVVAIVEHLFPGLITFQRLAATSSLDSVDIEIDSDDISAKLVSSKASIARKSVPTGLLLGLAYGSYRKQRFPTSPQLGSGGIHALADAKSRAIQLADVFGNFALAYIFVQLGHATTGRQLKADILGRVFGSSLSPSPIQAAAILAGPTNNDIQLTQPGGFTLEFLHRHQQTGRR